MSPHLRAFHVSTASAAGPPFWQVVSTISLTVFILKNVTIALFQPSVAQVKALSYTSQLITCLFHF